ncbi:HNH endonuclease [Dellaglioa algida]|uniref:HNH endonuclease n=1 Tax=Dellaglioa algida TaxID=105612 RepID=UPI0024DE643B|nr:HNH endonuclease [Dellaglioa algida]MDK1740083.1 HNH endonuclease [Dellaglioa algida]
MRDNVVRRADVVDHITPLKIDWSKRLDWNNWQGLCHSHHNVKTRLEQYTPKH